MMSARNSGKRVVAIAVTATVAAVGVGTIWAPFYADRDKLRGLHEEADGGMSERERQQYEEYLRKIQQGKDSSPGNNNMWSRVGEKQEPADKN